jgi:hypothetical protein
LIIYSKLKHRFLNDFFKKNKIKELQKKRLLYLLRIFAPNKIRRDKIFKVDYFKISASALRFLEGICILEVKSLRIPVAYGNRSGEFI